MKKIHLQDNLEIRNWKDLTKNSNNKADLLNFTAASVSKHPKILPRSITYISGGMMEDDSQTIILRTGVTKVIDELSCKSHEEADTRIFGHLASCL